MIASVDMWNQFKVSAGNVQPLSSEQKEPYGYLRDYATANRAMVFWLESNVPEEKALFEKILSSVEPGTPYLGWFSNDVAGYFYPNVWPDESFSKFPKRTYPYLRKTGMTIPCVLNRMEGANVPLSRAKADAYKNAYHAPGLFLSWEDRHGVEILDNGLPVSIVQGISTAQDGKNILERAKANWDGESPMFVSLGLFAWSMTPTDVVELTKSLGPEFEVVRADQYFELIRKAYGLTPAAD